MKSDNYFQHDSGGLYHLSAGALVYDNQGQILMHVFSKNVERNPFDSDIYTLIRETIEPNEPIEDAIHRGIKEETGSETELVDYLGAITGKARNFSSGVSFEKTTLYFAARLIDWQPDQRDQHDEEIDSDLRWYEPEKLIPLIKEQREITGSDDLDESLIVERFLDMEASSNSNNTNP
ncbi:hypothetical protein BRC19_01310 [Candidatus Saccharibacteria bacterium QS_5_54_17]|nr:MAG: hypothetical protein BRC19_01310 [Candidatus Saccharibacteria bacterium QS_5_54_17]